MSRGLTLVALTASLLLAASTGFLWLQWKGGQDELDSLRDQVSGKDAEILDLKRDLTRLEIDLAAARKSRILLEEELRKQKDRLRDTRAELVEASAKIDTADSSDEEESSGPARLAGNTKDRYVIQSIDEADGAIDDLIARGDIQGIWLLAADLLGLGEPGFEKLIELSKFRDDKEKAQSIQNLWSREEFFMGTFMRDLAAHSDDVLRFGLYLDDRNPAELPGFIQEIQREFDDDFGPILFGMYGGDDVELLDAHVARYRRIVEAGTHRGREVKLDEIAGIVGHIPTEAALDLLEDIARRAPANRRRDIATAMAWKRDARFLPILEAWKNEPADDRTLRTIEAAIRMLR